MNNEFYLSDLRANVKVPTYVLRDMADKDPKHSIDPLEAYPGSLANLGQYDSFDVGLYQLGTTPDTQLPIVERRPPARRAEIRKKYVRDFHALSATHGDLTSRFELFVKETERRLQDAEQTERRLQQIERRLQDAEQRIQDVEMTNKAHLRTTKAHLRTTKAHLRTTKAHLRTTKAQLSDSIAQSEEAHEKTLCIRKFETFSRFLQALNDKLFFLLDKCYPGDIKILQMETFSHITRMLDPPNVIKGGVRNIITRALRLLPHRERAAAHAVYQVLKGLKDGPTGGNAIQHPPPAIDEGIVDIREDSSLNDEDKQTITDIISNNPTSSNGDALFLPRNSPTKARTSERRIHDLKEQLIRLPEAASSAPPTFSQSGSIFIPH